MKKAIWVRTFFRGFHRWPDAPEQVAFLRNLHRHCFGVKVQIWVTGSDREVEFFILQSEVDFVTVKQLGPALKGTPSMSCEMMAEYIAEKLKAKNYHVHFVEVDEDGENGARVEYEN